MEYLPPELRSHFAQGLALMIVGGFVGWALGYWRRRRLHRQVLGGDLREVLNIEQILVKEHSDGRTTLRVRSLGSAPLSSVLTNPVGHDAFLKRAAATKATETLISMKDAMGSYLLYLLQPWVCGVTRGPFPHDVWVMAPVCEPGQLSHFQSTTVILIREADLKRFLDWEWCKRLYVEHGSDGGRVITLWLMAHEFKSQAEEIARLKAEGKQTRFVETMYILDLGLDTEEKNLSTRAIPWERFTAVLKDLGLPA
jgi:hypothetical protein